MNDREKQSDETMKELAKETEFLSREVQRLASIVRTLVEGMVYDHTRKYVFARMLMNHDAVVDEYGKKTAMPETTDGLLKKLRSENLDLMTEISNLLPYLKCERCEKQLLDRWDIAYSGLNDMVFCKDCYQKYLEELDRHPDG
jgi:hypothetical protein